MNVSELPDGTARLIIGYTRLDLGVPVEGEYVNLRECDSKTFAPLVPGAKYRITAWGLGGGFDEDRRRSQSPIMRNESTLSLGECLQDLQNSCISIFPSILPVSCSCTLLYRIIIKLNINNNIQFFIIII